MKGFIRNVELADAQAIADIYNKYVLETAISFETEAVSACEMRDRIATISASHPYFVYDIDGTVAGYCCVHQWKERKAYCHTLETTLYVSPDFRRMGIGSLLLAKLIEACRADSQCRALIACITEGNKASIAIHSKFGFERVSLFKQVGRKFGQWLDVVDMELLL